MALHIDELLAQLVERDASDLHLKAGQPPIMRIRGDLIRVPELALSVDEHTSLLVGILNEDRKERLNTFKEWTSPIPFRVCPDFESTCTGKGAKWEPSLG